VIFFLLKMGFYIDEEILDALAEDEHGKSKIFDWYEYAYVESLRRE
jgi:hypothetical protein